MAAEDHPPTTGLKLYNSFSRSLEPFVPVDPKGKQVKWYSCGPTVYDAAHMGHARSYISFDILRRVMSDYFGYDVFFVMNITDIDDKIIRRGRHEHLFSQYTEKTQNNIQKITTDVALAIEAYVQETLATTDPEKIEMREKVLTNVRSSLATVTNALLSNPDSDEFQEQQRQKLLKGSKDVLYEWLDTSRPQKQVFQNGIFERFAKSWEDEYFADMMALNVLPPDVLTRVSEYVPEIVAYIEQIIRNGYAYESNGSVYFDTLAFSEAPLHNYAKLVPEAVGDLKALEEGEGELIDRETEKRNPADFALWKASKLGEPSWESPWGRGRPGWHIECSAMASAIAGERLDIHTGGVDLKFPHHDNEIAQSEAYFDSDDWVKYFLHSGHLTIAGCKMSKSLKNFITIKDALKQYTASQLRLTFLLHSWKDTLDYSPSGMLQAVQVEQKIQEFFYSVKDTFRFTTPYPKWSEQDLELQKNLEKAKLAVHEALCDNVNTREAINALRDLISAGNVYIQNWKSQKTQVNGQALKQVAVYISRILRIFGVIPSYDLDSFGFRAADTSGEGVGNVEDIVLPYVEVLSEFREKVRVNVKGIKDPGIKFHLLKACDKIRDVQMPELGVRLEDHEGCPSVIKYVGREAMLREMDQKKRLEREQEAEKQRKKLEQLKLQQEKEAKARVAPSDMFLHETDKYSRFNEAGFPILDAEGNPLAKSQIKKLEKLYQQQKKRYEEYLSAASATSFDNDDDNGY